MKTKDFIKLLQSEDPTGEAFIRMPGGVPLFAEKKIGHWDGPYFYIDEENNFVYTEKEYKIDIYCYDIEKFIEDSIAKNKLITWEKIMEKIKFETASTGESRIKERYLKIAKDYYDEIFYCYNKT